MKFRKIIFENKIDTDKYNVFISDNKDDLNKLVTLCKYNINVKTVKKEIDIFKNDYSHFWDMYFFVFFYEKKIVDYKNINEDILNILNLNENMYNKLLKLKNIKHIILIVENCLKANYARFKNTKILLSGFDNKEVLESLWDFKSKFIDVFFIFMNKEQWDEIKFQNKSHIYQYILKM